MTRNIKKSFIWLPAVFALFSLQTVQAQFPLGIDVTVAPPYPIHLADFTAAENNIFVRINNPTQTTFNVFLSGTLRNEDTGMTIASDPNAGPGPCIDVPPGGRTVTGSELVDMFDAGRLVITGTTLDIIRGNRALPEGRYSLCMRAEDCGQPGKFMTPVPTEMAGCASFEVSYVEPPEITAPECGGNVDLTTGNIPILWSFIPPAGGMGTIQFRIEMIELDPPTRKPTEAFGSSPIIFETGGIQITSYNLQIGTDVPLEDGKTYAFRVVAYDDEQRVQFGNNGKSEICTFQYGTASGTPEHPVITAEYPLDGDIIPFSHFPLIVKFDPFDAGYHRFVSDVTLLTRSGVFDSAHHDLNWPSDPLTAQRAVTGFGDMTQEQSQYLPIYKTLSETPPAFTKGEDYTWNTDVEMVWRTQSINIPQVTSHFKVGMGPSKLSLPADDDTVSPGTVNFRWKTADEPHKILPDFSIVSASRGSAGSTFFNGLVDERWVIEVSKTERFDSIAHTIGGRLGATIDLTSTPDAVIAELYKNQEENFTITDPGRYYWHVKWMTSPDDVSDSRFYAISDDFSFVIGTGTSGGTTSGGGAVADTTGGCISVCNAPAITNRTARAGLAAGDNLIIGKFALTVQTITASAGNEFSGDGYVQFPFLNNVKIQVEFRNIQYNTEMKIFAGTVTAKEDRGFVSEEVSTTMGQVISMAGPEARALSDFLTDGERLVSAFTGSREIGMPIGIDREIDGNKYTIGIIAMEFTPERATLNAVMSLDFPQIGDQMIAFGVKDLCITPSGLGDEGRLYLARDWELYQDGDTRFAFKGAATADTTGSCYVSWDCHGFLCARIEGEITFPRSMLVPDQDDGTAGAGTVKGNFSLKACRGNNFMAHVTIDPFQISGVDGWGWQASNAWLDFSDMENPPGFTLPATYGDTTLLHGGSRMLNTWQGFYMENIEVRAPAQFQNTTTTNRITFGIRNTIIDGTGLTTSIRVNNILPLSQGSFQGWGISLDTINIDFVSNVFREGGISGKLAVPIFSDGQSLDYHMALTYSDSKLNYLCRVFARDTLTVPMWAARMRLRPDSEIRIQIGDSTYASTNLSGDIGINGDLISGGSAIPGLNFSGMVFEGFKLSTSEPHFAIDSLYFSHASPQKKVAGFPINVNDISLNITDLSRPGINFDLDIVLGDFSAEFGFGVFGRLSFEGGRFSAGFGGIDLRSIRIEQTISGVTLIGSLEFYNRDPVYGDGVKGYLDVTLPMKLRARLTAQFGTKKTSPTALYGTADNYPYWFVDGLVNFPGGVPIFSGFGIYGFGGGIYHHMRIDESSLPGAASTIAGTSAGGESTRTSVRYIPDFGTFLGMKLTAVLGTHPSSETFNMDATLSAEFNTTGGLNYIGISASGYIMASITERSSAKVWATVNIRYSIPADGNANLHGDFDVFVNVNDILTGAEEGTNRFVHATFHVDRDKWYFYMGTLDSRAGLKLRLGPVRADLLTYLMVGYDIPTRLPSPPDRILDLLYGGGAGRLGTEGAVASQLGSRNRDADQSKYNSGRGFAFGVFFNLESEMNFAIFYANLQLILGFDLNITQDDGRVCAETGLPPGLNNWYATGQIYAGLWGEMGVEVDLWFISGRFPFIDLAAAVMLRGGLPNPDWFSGRAALHYSVLNGLVEGSCNFEVNAGQKCSIVDADPFSGVEFIADIRPQAEDSPTSVFEKPSVSFNLPVERLMEFPTPTDDNPTLTRQFKPFIASFRLMLNNGTNALVPGTFELSERNTIATYKFLEALQSTTSYKIEVVVQADEYFRDGTIRRVEISGRTWEERREVTFTTAERPNVIAPENVVYTYPVENQRFFLKGENAGRGGLMKLDAGQDYLFYTSSGRSTYSYVARFKPLPSGDPVETPLVLHGLYVDYAMPALENDKMYAFQIIRKRTGGDLSVEISGPLSRLGSTLTRTSAEALRPMRFDMELSSVNIRREGKLLPGATVNPGEFLLYSYYFKTSKYSTLSEKLSASVFTADYQNIFIAELFDLKAIIPEFFDDFDINGVYRNGVQVLKPLLAVTAPFSYPYHTAHVNPFIYDMIPRLQNFMSTASGIIGAPSVTTLNRHGKGSPPVNSVSIGGGRVESPLSQGEIESAAGITRLSGVTYISASGLDLSRLLSGAGTSLSTSASYSVSLFASSLPTDPSNFRMFYETSNYVFQDFNALRGNVGSLLSSTFLGIPTVQNAMMVQNPQLLLACNELLRKSAADFRLTDGDYGVDLFYRIPTPAGNEKSSGLHVTKTFRYGMAPIVVPGGFRKRGW